MWTCRQGRAKVAGTVSTIMVAALSVGLAGCGGLAHGTFSVSPRHALLDVPVSVSLHGLDPGQRVTLEARASDNRSVGWRSTAHFTADRSGRVTLADRSTGGSYTGNNAMGLFELMRPTTGHSSTFLTPDDGYPVRLTARSDSHLVASTTLQRVNPRAVGVTSHALTLAHDGVVGTLYRPSATSPPRPGVLLFGGSEGGEALDFGAATLAGHGYPTLSLAYFGEPGLPKTLRDVPLEYFVKALRVLRATPGVDPHRLVTDGGSRGSEAALLLGSHFRRLVYAVVAASPTDHVNGSFPEGGVGWTLHGRPVPTAPTTDFRTPHPPDAPASIIDGKAIRGPVMTICGAQDLLWPSCDFAASIAGQREAAGRSTGDVHVRYPDAGHQVDAAVGYYSATVEPISPNGSALGGTLASGLEAAGDAHGRVLRFLAGL